MAVVIRLQGLSVTASSEDIRSFFSGLRVPDGGVHIIGGKLNEAFIIFASDEDARRAMSRSGKFIKDSRVTLLLSSKTEMQNVLERTTKNAELDQKQFEDDPKHARRSMDPEMGRSSASRSDYSPSHQHQMPSNPEDFFGVFLNGLPFSVNEGQIHDFFGGLLIEEILLLKNFKGQNNGRGFVRFATEQDLIEALKRDREYIGSRYIEVKLTTIHDWRKAFGNQQMDVNPGDYYERGRLSAHSERNPEHRDRSRSPMSQSRIVQADEEYCVMLENLPFGVEKDGIKQLFYDAKLENDQILFFADIDGRRSRSAFVLFRSIRDYCDAISQEKREYLNRWIYTRPISRENMIKILESQSSPPGNSERHVERSPSYPRDPYESEKVCVFVRNLPFDVRKVEIIDFFHGFNVTEDRVWVLLDHRGAGVGQALVLFGSEAEAMEALSLNGRRFLGSEVMMKCISHDQMKQLVSEPSGMQESIPREEQYLDMRSEPFYPHGGSLPDTRNPEDDMPMTNIKDRTYRGSDYEPRPVRSHSPQDRDNGFHGRFGSPEQRFDGPTCVQLVNLPFQIRPQEIYDFCYGYSIIPGSVSLQYEPSGKPKGSATLVFESRKEALIAVQELSGRPIGPRKIKLLLV